MASGAALRAAEAFSLEPPHTAACRPAPEARSPPRGHMVWRICWQLLKDAAGWPLAHRRKGGCALGPHPVSDSRLVASAQRLWLGSPCLPCLLELLSQILQGGSRGPPLASPCIKYLGGLTLPQPQSRSMGPGGPSGSQSLVAPGGGADCEGAASTPLLGHLGLKGPPPWGRPRVPGATSLEPLWRSGQALRCLGTGTHLLCSVCSGAFVGFSLSSTSSAIQGVHTGRGPPAGCAPAVPQSPRGP